MINKEFRYFYVLVLLSVPARSCLSLAIVSSLFQLIDDLIWHSSRTITHDDTLVYEIKNIIRFLLAIVFRRFQTVSWRILPSIRTIQHDRDSLYSRLQFDSSCLFQVETRDQSWVFFSSLLCLQKNFWKRRQINCSTCQRKSVNLIL